MTIKTYSRAIDLRSYIEARPELAALPYEIRKAADVTASGAKKVTARFTVQNDGEANVVAAHGFTYLKAKAEAAEPKPEPKPEPIIRKEPEPMPQPKTLADKAMLADLTIKGWSGMATDAEIGAIVAQQYQASEEWVTLRKRLVRKDATKAIKKAEAAARATHKELTVAWTDGGARLLPGLAFHDYQTRMGQHRDDHEAAVDAFVAEYEELKAEARIKAGGLYNEADYPTAAEVQAKFVFETELSALDATGDIRVAMGEDERKALQEQVTRRVEARLANAMTEVYQRLFDVVSHMADRLRAYKPKTGDDDKVENPFRDATLKNVQHIVDLLPKLNVTADPELDKLAAEVRQNLLEADAATLRKDDDRRAQVAAEADKILTAMSGMM